MARTITREDMVYASFPIVKMEQDGDGDVIIYGKATDGTIDADRQRVDPAWSGPALEKWLATKGNIRVMHSPHLYPAGKGMSVEVDRDGDGGHWVRARIVEPTAKKLVKAGVLQDFSIGIAHPVIKPDVTGKAVNGIVTGNDKTEVHELSICDRGSNYNSGFGYTLAKSAGLAVEWTYGDLEALLAKVEADDYVALKAADAKPDDATYVDPTDAGGPDDESAPGSSADEDDRPDVTDDSGDPDDDAVKAYIAAVTLHKAAKPKRNGIPLSGTDFLAKAAAWQRWSQHGEDEGLDGTPAGYERWLGKRDMDPDVGGGVDRDKIPDQDHVDPEGRRFPIVKPGDVPDAVSSYGRADPKIPFKRFKRRLTAIARRKGPEFEQALPESWKKADKSAEPYHREPDETVKCPNCGKYNMPDARFCDQCGKPLPDSVTKDITLTSPDPQGLVPYNLTTGDPVMAKGGKDCPDCGKSYDADSKLRRCENCGAKLPKGYMGKTVDKGRVTDRDLPADVKPAGEHREPDGDAVEALEADAGLPTDPDKVHDQVPASVKAKGRKGKKPAFPGAAPPFGGDGDSDDDMATKGAVYTVQRMHDATCAAYDWPDVAAKYPALKSVGDALDPVWYRTAASAALAKGDMPQVGALAACHQSADVIAKGLVEPAILADARAQVHKSFTDMYPTTHVTPGNVTPGMFQRPYVSAGHAPLNASAGVKPQIPPSSHTISADQFDRPLITAGHQAESPGDMGGNNPVGSVATGSGRALYGMASKAAAENALKALHDHLVAADPGMCPMAPSRAVLPPDNGAKAVPVPTAPLAVPAAPGEKAAVIEVAKAQSAVDVDALVAEATQRIEKAATKAARKAAKTNQNGELVALVNKMATALAATNDTIAELRSEIDELGAQPDPAQAPLRGVVRQAPTPTVEPQVEKQATVDPDDEERVRVMGLLAKSANPVWRDKANSALSALLDGTP